MKRTVLAWWIWSILIFVSISGVVVLSGCAEQRFLTKEQDEQFREQCADHGCTLIPTPQWEMIEKVLQRLGMLPS